jgi:hypothetical protein
LDRALCPDNEAPDFAYDQIQVCPVQHGKAGETFAAGWKLLTLFQLLEI